MSTLLLRLAAPMQSWGIDKFERRGTERIPTKSGVIGIIAAALGRRRNEGIEDLLSLRFGVRVDREGKLLRDYHIAHEEKFWATRNGKYVHLTTRYYLSDAVFLVGLEGEDALLERIDYALHHPKFPLFLGRRSCPPEGKLSLGIRTDITLKHALQEEPWQVSDWLKKKENTEVRLHISIDAGADAANGYLQRDLPISFDQSHRKYGFRRVSGMDSTIVSNPIKQFAVSKNSTEHDPMLELEEE